MMPFTPGAAFASSGDERRKEGPYGALATGPDEAGQIVAEHLK